MVIPIIIAVIFIIQWLLTYVGASLNIFQKEEATTIVFVIMMVLNIIGIILLFKM